MARDILSEYGPDKAMHNQPRASSGGVERAKDLSYKPPQGPTSIGNKGVGLGGSVSHCGSQGHYSTGRESGSPGIGGDKHPKGSQR